MDFGILDVQFNNISLDRAGTQISDLPGFTSSLSSVKTGNKSIYSIRYGYCL
jgi:hypothetical protein